ILYTFDPIHLPEQFLSRYTNNVNPVRPIVQIPQGILTQIQQQAISEHPNECCGLLSGLISSGFALVRHCFPLTNTLQSPTRFLSDPKEMFQAHKEIRRRQESLLVVYHSHPHSEPIPSAEDLRQSLSPAVACLIIGFPQRVPVWRIWWLNEEHYFPAEYQILTTNSSTE
ncbi:MAG: M67 family metallopeptidase, partial [Gemmataceae bacterium]|nr:M67 family metallopeptidase [Gemmataceae bacterium]